MATQPQQEVVALRMICPHGKVRMICSTRPEILKDARREISEMMMEGFTSERVPVEVARKSDMDCPECDALWAAKKAAKNAARRSAKPRAQLTLGRNPIEPRSSDAS